MWLVFLMNLIFRLNNRSGLRIFHSKVFSSGYLFFILGPVFLNTTILGSVFMIYSWIQLFLVLYSWYISNVSIKILDYGPMSKNLFMCFRSWIIIVNCLGVSGKSSPMSCKTLLFQWQKCKDCNYLKINHLSKKINYTLLNYKD